MRRGFIKGPLAPLAFMIAAITVPALSGQEAPSAPKQSEPAKSESKPAKTEDEVVLGTITVKGEAISAKSQPTTVHVVAKEKLQELHLREAEKALEEVPGIEIHRYGMGGVANEFAIRGFNNAGHGGDAAIAIDGIILNEGESHADGYADMNVIIPLELDRVEVFKGPSSPLFGNFARGGALSFHTRKTGEYNILEASGGSFGTSDFQQAMGHALGAGVQLNTALQFSSTKGYQDNSDWRRGNFSGRLSWQVTQDLDIALSTRVHESTWDAPGYIPEAQFNNPETWFHQAVNAEKDGGNKKFTTEKIELGYNLSDSSRILAWTYGTQQNFTRFSKFGYGPGNDPDNPDQMQTERFYDRNVFGAGTSYNYVGQVAGHELNGVAGVEYLHENTIWDRWNTSNRVRTAQIEDRTFNINTTSLFAEVKYALHPLFNPWLGLRYDSFSGDYVNTDPGVAPTNSKMNSYSHLSPKLGFTSALHQTLDFKASFSQGFALPSDVLKFNSAAGNTPSTINQYELGMNYHPAEVFSANLAVFRIGTQNELLEYPAGTGIYINLGKTRRDGVEVSTTVRPGLPGLELHGDLTLMNTEITENPDATVVGKQVTGVPTRTCNVGVSYKADSGFSTRLKWRHVAKFYIDSANTTSYEGYNVADVSLGYEAKTNKGQKWRINFEADNAFNKHYTQAAWNGYGTNNYAVSPPRNFWIKMGLDY